MVRRYSGETGSQPVRAGDVICLYPGIPHAYGPAGDERWDEVNVEFSGPTFDAWRGPGLLDPEVPIRHLEPIGYRLSRFARRPSSNQCTSLRPPTRIAACGRTCCRHPSSTPTTL